MPVIHRCTPALLRLVLACTIVNASTKTPDELVYRVVKALHASKAKLVASHKAFNGFDPKMINRDVGLAYHAGAIKFFKEVGLQ